MPVESICAGCGKRLRVADEFAGKKARCPSCGEIYMVPAEHDEGREPEPSEGIFPEAATPTEYETRQRYLQTPEQRIYGPVDRSHLDRWVREGRVSAGCFLRSGAHGAWQRAEDLCEFLASSAGSAVRAGNPFAADATPGRSHASGTYTTGPQTYAEPHRGELILALGVVCWVISCPLLSVIAWWLGTADLRAMREGRMDPTGQGLTQAGQILGMVHAVISILALVGVLFVFLIIVAANF
jgi:hypothetical protein